MIEGLPMLLVQPITKPEINLNIVNKRAEYLEPNGIKTEIHMSQRIFLINSNIVCNSKPH